MGVVFIQVIVETMLGVYCPHGLTKKGPGYLGRIDS